MGSVHLEWCEIRHAVAKFPPPHGDIPIMAPTFVGMEKMRNMRHAVDIALKDTPVVLINGAGRPARRPW